MSGAIRVASGGSKGSSLRINGPVCSEGPVPSVASALDLCSKHYAGRYSGPRYPPRLPGNRRHGSSPTRSGQAVAARTTRRTTSPSSGRLGARRSSWRPITPKPAHRRLSGMRFCGRSGGSRRRFEASGPAHLSRKFSIGICPSGCSAHPNASLARQQWRQCDQSGRDHGHYPDQPGRTQGRQLKSVPRQEPLQPEHVRHDPEQ